MKIYCSSINITSLSLYHQYLHLKYYSFFYTSHVLELFFSLQYDKITLSHSIVKLHPECGPKGCVSEFPGSRLGHFSHMILPLHSNANRSTTGESHKSGMQLQTASEQLSFIYTHSIVVNVFPRLF